MLIHVVKPGDTVYSIALEYGIPMSQLILDNGLETSSRLAVGQALVVQFPTQTHTVHPGETLASIAAAAIAMADGGTLFIDELELLSPPCQQRLFRLLSDNILVCRDGYRAVDIRVIAGSAGELAAKLEELAGRLRLLAVVDTLKYLKMGGRISTASAVVGALLNINPIITIENGLVEGIGKARGRKAAFQWIAKRMEKEAPDLSLPVSFGHTNAPEAMAECQAFFADTIGGATVHTSNIGSVVGTHVGPGATGIVYFRAE